MKKLVIILFVLFVTLLSANQVDNIQANLVANNWIQHSHRSVSVLNEKPIVKNGVTLWYLFNLKPQGFILISADDAAYPILGYSYEHNFEYPIKSPEVRYWISNYEKQLEYIIANRLDNSGTIKFWRSILEGDFSFDRSNRDVAPLTQTLWDQGQYYNEQCPYDASSTAGNNHVWAGCVATATAQIMKYWSYPSHGTGSHSYNENDYGTQSADFGATTYNWAAMPNSPSSVIDDVTTLLYHLGVAVEMDYSPTGSGAWCSDAVSALETYFSYNSDAVMLWKSDYSTTDWENLLKTDLDNGRPILYRGQGDDGGHAFVCDGYEGTNHFHINWGWSGSSNGYYYLDNLNPGSYTFNDYQGAGVHIYPNTTDFPEPTNLTASVNNGSVDLSWQAPTRALSSYKIYRDESYLATTTNTNYTDSSVSQGHIYTYYVTAVYTSPDGESVHSNTAKAVLSLDLPYSTDFSSSDGWWQNNESCSDRWASSSSSAAGGTSPEMKASWENANPATSRLVSPPINTSGMSRVNLSFKHYFDYYSSSNITIKIQSSADGASWTDEAWIHINPAANIGPETVNTYISNNLGDVTYIAWVITGNLYNFDYWYLDDVSITIPLPVFDLSPTSIDYGNVEVNSSSVQQFTISNTGYNNLTGDITTISGFTVQEVTRDGQIVRKSIRNTLSYTVGEGASKTFNLTFTPTSATTYSGNITITSNDDTHSTNYLSVQGTGVVPDISVNPTSYNITMETNSTHNENLNISNTDLGDLNYSITAHNSTMRGVMAVYPTSLSDWTGTTDGNTKTQHSIVNAYNNQDGWMKFDISSLPDGAIVDSVIFYGYVYDTNWPYWSVTPISNDPVTTSASTLRGDIIAEQDGGYYLHRNESSTFAAGWHNYTLGGNANTDLQNALSQDWFAIGIASRDNSTQYYINFHGWNETNKPYLVVYYTIEVPWITFNGAYSYSSTVAYGANEDVTIGFDTNGMANGTYSANIAITSNDPDENPYTIPVTLTVQNLAYINVTPTSLDYGDVYIGSPQTKQFTIQNTGLATLSGQIVLIDDYHISTATKSETYDFTVAPQSSQTYNLQCDPQTAGAHNGTITINSNAQNSAQKTILVTANAIYHAIMSINVDSLYFGNVLLGNYTSQQFTITNNGNETLTGVITPPTDYYVYASSRFKGKPGYRDTLSFSIEASQSKDYIVYFYPATTGEKTGTITFTSNDPYNTPPQIKVDGTGYLNPPENITISFEGNNVKINWDYNSRVSIYHVYQSDKPDSGFTEMGTIAIPPYTIINGVNQQKKFYRVTAE